MLHDDAETLRPAVVAQQPIDKPGSAAPASEAARGAPTAYPLSGSATTPRPISRRSAIGLNAANFFLAEITGVVLPFLGAYFKGQGWNEDRIGDAIGIAGLGVFLLQTPAGLLVDRLRFRRALLAAASVAVGLAYGLVPLAPPVARWIDPLLFSGGAAQAFFAPLLGALALGLVGHAGLNRMMGANQSWNHAGNLASALLAMAIVGLWGVASIFYAVAIVSLLAAGSVFLIRHGDVDEDLASGGASKGTSSAGAASDEPGFVGGGKCEGRAGVIRHLVRDRRVWALLAATALFHLGNAPVMPFLGAYIKQLHGNDTQVAAVVLVAQAVMIPVALAAGWLVDRWGRKPVFAIGFIALPLRIFLYSLTDDPWTLVALQSLDGIGAGIYGVAIVAMCADLTRGRGGFNALSGLMATALAAGGALGPFIAGRVAAWVGYNGFFYVFAMIAALAAVVFLCFVPETKPRSQERIDGT